MMTCIEVTCTKCGTKYFRGVFDGGCPKCYKLGKKSWDSSIKEEKRNG